MRVWNTCTCFFCVYLAPYIVDNHIFLLHWTCSLTYAHSCVFQPGKLLVMRSSSIKATINVNSSNQCEQHCFSFLYHSTYSIFVETHTRIHIYIIVYKSIFLCNCELETQHTNVIFCKYWFALCVLFRFVSKVLL